jgi:four helix bundle protein
MTTQEKIQSLRERIRKFVLEVISFSRPLAKNDLNRILINQLLRSTTSIGANFEEASEAESNKDVIHKLAISKKEVRETVYWLEIIRDSKIVTTALVTTLISEAIQLARIFSSLIQRRKLSNSAIDH